MSESKGGTENLGALHGSSVAALRRRLNCARRRAVYWSGRPSFSGHGFSPSNRARDHELEYEAAMCDIASLCDEIEKATGKRPRERDVKQEYRDAFSGVSIR